jgi:hypothetical protein
MPRRAKEEAVRQAKFATARGQRREAFQKSTTEVFTEEFGGDDVDATPPERPACALVARNESLQNRCLPRGQVRTYGLLESGEGVSAIEEIDRKTDA